jgi:hypothetical protein
MIDQAIPDSIRAKIAKMLAIANDSRGNENVAATAAAMVQKLLAQYNLDMSQIGVMDVDQDDRAPIDPDAVREKANDVAMFKESWKAELMTTVAACNFCYAWSEAIWTDAGKQTGRRYGLIGRRVNVASTRQVFEYLCATLDRLNPFADKRTISHRSWFEGAANRLSLRLYDQKRASEAESRQATQEAPRGNGRDLVLADVYSSESDLNYDMLWGDAPGTCARRRMEREAARAEREANPEPVAPVKAETEAQRRVREAKEAREWARTQARWARDDAKRAARIDRDAYAMGDNAGRHISLNRQID